MEGVWRDGGQDQYCVVFVSRGCRYQVTVSFRLPPLQPSPVSWIIKQHVCARGGRVTGRLNALWSSRVMRSVNSWWTCSDAPNIGRYNSSRFDTIHPVSVPIRYRSNNCPFSITDLHRLKDVFTFCNDAGNAFSWIDHFRCSHAIDSLVSDCSVHYQYATSDHKPISVIPTITCCSMTVLQRLLQMMW